MPRSRLLLACIAVCTALASFSSAQNRTHLADVELVGPVTGVVLDAGHAGLTRIEGALGAGESRRLTVPVPIESEALRTEPIVRFDEPTSVLDPRGRVRFVGWSTERSPLVLLTAGLRARTLPAVSESHVRVSRAAPLVLVAALVVALALRRRSWLALVTAIAVAAALRPLAVMPERESDAAVTLLDGDAASESWRRVDAAIDTLAIPRDADAFELVCDPAPSPVTWIVAMDGSVPWRARSSGARLFVESVFAAGEGRVSRARNALFALDETWVRDEEGWTARGPWPVDAPLPATGSAGSPPGWLASNLPQGVPIVIGRALPEMGKPLTWVRITLP